MDPNDPNGYYSGDPGLLIAAYFSIFFGVIVFSLLVGLAAYVVTALSLMSFFRKVGVRPWIAWVPVYNNWVWLEVGGQRGWLSLLSIIPYGGTISAIFLYIGMYRSGLAFGKTGGFLVLGIFLPFVWAFILGSRAEVYRPELITAAGYGLPLAGYGSVGYNYANAWSAPGWVPPAA
jgi:vacuolar-type H+-ATPase subunit I/STV1